MHLAMFHLAMPTQTFDMPLHCPLRSTVPLPLVDISLCRRKRPLGGLAKGCMIAAEAEATVLGDTRVLMCVRGCSLSSPENR